MASLSLRRLLSSSSPLRVPAPPAPSPAHVFDRRAKMLQRDRAAASASVGDYERLKDEVAWQVCDRMYDIARTFPRVLDLGCGRGYIGRHLQKEVAHQLVQCDISAGMLTHFPADARDRGLRLQGDEEALPFADNTFDAVLSSLSLHWVNDLPRALREVHRVLKPDGVFIGAMLGGDTLFQLRGSVQLAEQDLLGGFSPRMSPVVHKADVGSLLQQSRFALLTVDTDDITISYPSAIELLDDLQGMAESSASTRKVPAIRRQTLLAAAAVYQSVYGDEQGHVPATFEIMHCIGWKPDPSQAKPAARGSATHSLKDAIGQKGCA